MYQSIDWGGSSFDGEVLTVSTQPEGPRIKVSVFISLGVCGQRTWNWEFSLSL